MNISGAIHKHKPNVFYFILISEILVVTEINTFSEKILIQ